PGLWRGDEAGCGGGLRVVRIEPGRMASPRRRMRASEMFYTVQEVSLLLRLHEKTVVEWLKRGEFGRDVVNLGTDQRPQYRIPASGVNGLAERRRVFLEKQEPGIAAR